MSSPHINMNQLAYLKMEARRQGVKLSSEVIDLSAMPMLGNGHIAEIAMIQMLGALQNYMSEWQLGYLYIEVSADLDMKGIDMIINRKPISVVTHHKNQVEISDEFNLYFDEDGSSNMLRFIREALGFTFVVCDETLTSFDQIWEIYMKGLVF